ncbi:MAG: hypothetical protein JNM56_07805 [Planctomycetia bacterium]|nr:hypothetical protein [Planctomycetia bacterium]
MNQSHSETLPSSVLEQLVAGVHHRLNCRIRNFRVRYHDGGLVLDGSTPTYHVKQLAQHCIMELTDLPILANEIAVG